MGAEVSYAGVNYVSVFYAEPSQRPDTSNGTGKPWRVVGACDTSIPPPPPPPPPPAPPPPEELGPYQVGSYFAAWSIYDRKFYIKNIVTSGEADHLTFLNYAFGNLLPKNGGYECGIVQKAETGNADGGDQWADYAKTMTAGESVDGVADNYNDKLKGNFGQLKRLKRLHPNIKLFISLGGWTWSKWFGEASNTEAKRRQLVSSCIDLYLDGNLPVGQDAGGPGTAFGIFDGIDVDWEFPGGGGMDYNTVDPNDRQNFTLLLQEFRRQLDDYGRKHGRKYWLTVAIGAGPDKIAHTDPREYSKSLDWINVMTYDFHGGWEPQGPTNFHSNLYFDPSSPGANQPGADGLTVDAAITTLLREGVPPKKLIVGVPFYGRGWTGVTAGANNGLYQPATQPAPGTYESGFEDYKVLKNRPGDVRVHAITKQSWKYDGSTFWSYDTPDVLMTKVHYVQSKALGGLFSWQLDSDTDNGELSKTIWNVQGDSRPGNSAHNAIHHHGKPKTKQQP
jgi:chitinase